MRISAIVLVASQISMINMKLRGLTADVVNYQYSQRGLIMNDPEVNKMISEANERMKLLQEALDVAMMGLSAINVHKNDIAIKTIKQINSILNRE